MSLRLLKLFAILLPPFIIGGFEYLRHELLLKYVTMEAGNFYITVITLILSYLFASWMFRSIDSISGKLAVGEARRAVYEDRERLARELHDNLAQTLFFLNVKLKQGQLEDAKAAVSEIDNSLRQAIFNLRTPPEEGAAFMSRLRKWLKDWQKITGIELAQDLQFPDHAFSPAEEVQLFGIIQEAFTNIRKHSKATHAEIRIHADAWNWSLNIADNGCGLGQEAITNKHYGIDMMHKRAAELGTALVLAVKPEGGGTVLLISGKRGNH